jgi:hypothetical protein
VLEGVKKSSSLWPRGSARLTHIVAEVPEFGGADVQLRTRFDHLLLTPHDTRRPDKGMIPTPSVQRATLGVTFSRALPDP